MPEDAQINIRLVTNTDDIANEIKRIQSLGKETSETERQRLSLLKEQYKTLKQQEDILNKVKSQSQQIGISLARIIQDAPFGLVGIGNNITFLAEQLETIRKNAAAAGQSLSTMSLIAQGVGQLFTSPVGLISIATTAATVFSKAFEPAIDSAQQALTRFSDALGITDSKFDDFVKQYEKRLNKIVQISEQKTKPKVFSNREDIVSEIQRYQSALNILENNLQYLDELKAQRSNPNIAITKRFIGIKPKSIDDENKQRKLISQRIELIKKDLDRLNELLKEFDIASITQPTLDRPTVEQGVPTIGGKVRIKEQIIEAPKVTLETVLKRLQILQPEIFAPIDAFWGLTIEQLEGAISRLTQKIKTEGANSSLAARLKALKKVYQQKLEEAGITEPKEQKQKNILDLSFSPSTRNIFLNETLMLKTYEAELKRLRDEEKKLRLTEDAKRYFYGGSIAPLRLYEQSQDIQRIFSDSQDNNPLLAEFLSGLGLQTGTGLARALEESLMFQSEFVRKERELQLERLRQMRINNERIEQETLRSLRKQEHDIDIALQRQLITDAEAAAKKQELEAERTRLIEEQALKRKEIALEEEKLRSQSANTIKQQVIANSINYAIEFAFNSLAKDSFLLAPLGLFGLFLAPVILAPAIALLKAFIMSNVASLAYGGIVKSPSLAIIGDAKRSGNPTNEEVIFNERLLVRQAERFAAMTSNQVIILNGRKVNEELRRSDRLKKIITIR